MIQHQSNKLEFELDNTRNLGRNLERKNFHFQDRIVLSYPRSDSDATNCLDNEMKIQKDRKI